MVYYVKTVHVQYDDSSQAIEGGDINQGMGWTSTSRIPRTSAQRLAEESNIHSNERLPCRQVHFQARGGRLRFLSPHDVQ